MFDLPDGYIGSDVFEHGTQAEYMSEAFAEYARNHGEMDPTQAWISTPFDTWERNPHYHGPPVPHPEDESQFRDDDLDYEVPPLENDIPF